MAKDSKEIRRRGKKLAKNLNELGSDLKFFGDHFNTRKMDYESAKELLVQSLLTVRLCAAVAEECCKRVESSILQSFSKLNREAAENSVSGSKVRKVGED